MTWTSTAPAVITGLFGSSSALAAELISSDAALRAPLVRCRRVGFVQLGGGSGTSTAAAYVSNLLAHRRAGMVAAVNASGGGVNVLTRAGIRASVRRAGAGAGGASARTACDAQAGLARSGSGLYGLDLAQDAAAADWGTWLDRVTPIARFFDVVATDWGVRHSQLDLGPLAALNQVVCLVARTDRYAAEQAAALASDLVETDRPPQVVLALVDVGRTGERTPQLLRRRLSFPVLKIPYEPRHAAVRPHPSRDLAARTRLAYIRLATALMTPAPTIGRPSPIATARPLASARAEST